VMQTTRNFRTTSLVLVIALLVSCLLPPSEAILKKKLRLLVHGALAGGVVGGAVGYAVGKHHGTQHHTVWIQKHHKPYNLGCGGTRLGQRRLGRRMVVNTTEVSLRSERRSPNSPCPGHQLSPCDVDRPICRLGN
ncbi:hypothetical protein BIW11_06215, partial [Tropilaelaps mercedesae]